MTELLLDASQERAVDMVCSARVAIITGGPGTGKSTCLRVALDRMDRRGSRYELCSPTGKAAKRLSEATEGRRAQTIHRLLEYSPGMDGFKRNADNPLECDVVIVDEASMVDTMLFASLMRAIAPARTRLILVGDANQLPPVGPGRPFGDLVDWGRVPTVRLEVLHRTALTSWIHVAAQDLLHGQMPALEARPDFRWCEVHDPRWIIPKVRRLVTEVFGPGGKLEAEAQVLIPQRPGLAGIEAANPALQEALNPKRAEERVWLRGDWELRPRDLVIQTRNDYNLEVFNGEIGRVVAIGQARDEHDKFVDFCEVQFAGHAERSTYFASNIAALQLAYALTIHRTQGSEFPWAIVVCHSTHAFILSRQLLYTAITRAKAGVVLVGDRKGLERAVNNRRTDERNTSLVERLDDTLDPVGQYSLLEEDADGAPTIH
jgi:exodeoxyribonuclease V alpha subunit